VPGKEQDMKNAARSTWAYGIIGALVLAMAVFSMSCKNQGNGNAQAKEVSPPSVPASIPVQTPPKVSAASLELSQAQSTGKYAYLMFYESGNNDCEIMKKNLDSFAAKTKKNVEVIQIDRKDPANRDIVTRMRTQAAPIPLTLLTNSSGSVISAFTKVVSAEELAQAFPFPKQEETLKYIQQEKKGVILCFADKHMASRKDIQSCCSQAETKLSGKAEYVSVDLSDPAEAGFMKNLKVNPDATEPVTLVVNAKGQVTGTYNGKVEVDQLVAAATKVVSSGCGPGSSCAPGACGPTK